MRTNRVDMDLFFMILPNFLIQVHKYYISHIVNIIKIYLYKVQDVALGKIFIYLYQHCARKVEWLHCNIINIKGVQTDGHALLFLH